MQNKFIILNLVVLQGVLRYKTNLYIANIPTEVWPIDGQSQMIRALGQFSTPHHSEKLKSFGWRGGTGK